MRVRVLLSNHTRALTLCIEAIDLFPPILQESPRFSPGWKWSQIQVSSLFFSHCVSAVADVWTHDFLPSLLIKTDPPAVATLALN